MKKSFFVSFVSMLGSLFFLGCIVSVGVVLGVLVYFGRDLPDYRQLEKYEPLMTTRLYANDGQLLAEYASERRVFVPVSAIPKQVIHAFLSAEDKNFYSHGGLDFQGILRAVITNIKNYGKKGNLVGASTITQQVAKNFLLSSEQSYTRKIKEALLARRIEQTFDKDHILELYLNQIFLGFVPTVLRQRHWLTLISLWTSWNFMRLRCWQVCRKDRALTIRNAIRPVRWNVVIMFWTGCLSTAILHSRKC